MRALLEAFFGNLSYRLRLMEQTRAHTDLYLSTRFNIFDYIEPDEVRLSDIIADMLDPCGAHAQADRFLRLFLQVVCKRTDCDTSGCRVKREDPTLLIQRHRREIDILLDLDGFAVAIENKPWAAEQPAQVGDYVEHLRKRFGESFLLIFLSSDGREPRTPELADRENLKRNGQLLCVSYSGAFKLWLDACVKDCESDKVRWFIRDFIGFVEREFHSEYTDL